MLNEKSSKILANSGQNRLDGFVKNPMPLFNVIPVEAGIQQFQNVKDFRLRGNDV